MKITLFILIAMPLCAQDLIDFHIQDQFKQVHVTSDYAGEVVIVIGSDKNGCDYDKLWAAELSQKLGDSARVLPVAHMKGVPFFLKGFIRGKFPKQPENWILMDWGGKFNKVYSFEPGLANILVFDRQGKQIFKAAAGELDQGIVSELILIINNSTCVDKNL
ncbi:hypothetical protein HN388_03075 [bacterium]|nr:hypothetical protein [bacterium]MBT7311665.1 hypothetical protein [bacterium]